MNKLLAVLAVVLVMAGCGGKDAKDKPPAAGEKVSSILDDLHKLGAAASAPETSMTYTAGAAASAAETLTVSAPYISSNTDSIPMVLVEGGTFTMGCTEKEDGGAEDTERRDGDCDDRFKNCQCDEKPARKVILSSFYLGKYELTQGIWKTVMGGNPSDTFSGRYGVGDNYPVYYVSWDDVQNFIAALNAKTGKRYRLPTEAEWEYAARGGNKSKGYRFSGGDSAGGVAWHNDDRYGTGPLGTKPVGAKAPNELGFYDMSGNVWEWVGDRYEANPAGPQKGSYRVCRGGGWFNFSGAARVSNRNYRAPSRSGFGMGFRLAHDAGRERVFAPRQGAGSSRKTQEAASFRARRADTDSVQSAAPASAKNMDIRLVNRAEGEAWARYTGGSRLWSFTGVVFHADGKLSVIEARGELEDFDNWVEDPQFVDNWNVKTPGTWRTEGGRMIMVSISGRTTAIPYTVKTLEQSGGWTEETLEFDLEGLWDDSYNVESLGDYSDYFGFDYNRAGGLALPNP